jgi:NTP pyrophosphatase (non-canonical NTP hydrolase)
MSELKDLLRRAEEIRQKYDEINAKNGKDAWRIRDYAMGLTGDIGDLNKLIMSKENVREELDVDEKLGRELADILWSVLIIANNYGIDLDNEFTKTMQKIDETIIPKATS